MPGTCPGNGHPHRHLPPVAGNRASPLVTFLRPPSAGSRRPTGMVAVRRWVPDPAARPESTWHQPCRTAFDCARSTVLQPNYEARRIARSWRHQDGAGRPRSVETDATPPAIGARNSPSRSPVPVGPTASVPMAGSPASHCAMACSNRRPTIARLVISNTATPPSAATARSMVSTRHSFQRSVRKASCSHHPATTNHAHQRSRANLEDRLGIGNAPVATSRDQPGSAGIRAWR